MNYTLLRLIQKDEQRELGNQLYSQLNGRYDVLYDDRQERAGVKFNDADLIGLPVLLSVKRAGEGIVEAKQRLNGESEDVHIDDLENYLKVYMKI